MTPNDREDITVPLTKQLRSPFVAGRTAAADAARLARTLRVLADPSRLRILSLIKTLGAAGEVCAVDLAAATGLSQPTVSHHLLALVDAGLVAGERVGPRIRLSVVDARLEEIARALVP